MVDATLKSALDEALDDEYKAIATYEAALRKFGRVRPFTHLVEAERRHAAALVQACQRHGLRPTKDRWQQQIQSPETVLEACRQGEAAEIANADLYDRLLALPIPEDVREVFRNLRRASQQNHLPAFRRCLDHHAGRGRRRGGKGEAGGGPKPAGLAKMASAAGAVTFAMPEDVLASALGDAVKKEYLLRWAYDVVEMQVAEEEGMPGPEVDMLPRIILALNSLGVELDLEHVAPNKEHGFHERPARPAD